MVVEEDTAKRLMAINYREAGIERFRLFLSADERRWTQIFNRKGQYLRTATKRKEFDVNFLRRN